MLAPSTVKRVRSAVVRRGITQTAFAVRVGVSPSHLSAVLNGRMPISKLVSRCLMSELSAIEAEALELDRSEQQVVEMPRTASRVVA